MASTYFNMHENTFDFDHNFLAAADTGIRFAHIILQRLLPVHLRIFHTVTEILVIIAGADVHCLLACLGFGWLNLHRMAWGGLVAVLLLYLMMMNLG